MKTQDRFKLRPVTAMAMVLLFSSIFAAVPSLGSTPEYLVPIAYDHVYGYEGDFFVVVKDEKKGLVDFTGALVVDTLYDNIKYKENDLHTVSLDKKWGLINSTGRVLLPMHYEDVDHVTDGFAAIRIDGKWGFASYDGKFVNPIQCKYDKVTGFSNGLAAVAVQGEGFTTIYGDT